MAGHKTFCLFAATHFVQLLAKFHCSILTSEEMVDNFPGLTKSNRKFSNLNFCQKVAKLQYFAISLRSSVI